jgi:hypothetical protein
MLVAGGGTRCHCTLPASVSALHCHGQQTAKWPNLPAHSPSSIEQARPATLMCMCSCPPLMHRQPSHCNPRAGHSMQQKNTPPSTSAAQLSQALLQHLALTTHLGCTAGRHAQQAYRNRTSIHSTISQYTHSCRPVPGAAAAPGLTLTRPKQDIQPPSCTTHPTTHLLTIQAGTPSRQPCPQNSQLLQAGPPATHPPCSSNCPHLAGGPLGTRCRNVQRAMAAPAGLQCIAAQHTAPTIAQPPCCSQRMSVHDPTTPDCSSRSPAGPRPRPHFSPALLPTSSAS